MKNLIGLGVVAVLGAGMCLAGDQSEEHARRLMSDRPAGVDADGGRSYGEAQGFDCVIDPIILDQHVVATDAVGVNSVHAADIDGDGDTDVVSASTTDNRIVWYENDGATPPQFTAHELTNDADSARSVFAIDLDGDDDVDIVAGSALDWTVRWFENNGAIPPAFTEHIITTSSLFTQAVYAADLDGDGDVDVLSASSAADTVWWFENNGGSPPVFTPRVVTDQADSVRGIFAADVDGDGHMDVLSASSFDSTVAWYENDGGSPPSFARRVISSSATGAQNVFAVDFDGDLDIDVLVAATAGDFVSWYENDGADNPSFTEHVITTTQDFPISVIGTDLDGNGTMDVVVASTADDTIAWYSGDGASPPNFTLLASASADGAQSVFVTDIDGDDSLDILGGSGFDNTIAWYVPTEPALGACCLPDATCQPDTCLVDCAAALGWAWHAKTACGEVTCPGLTSPAQFLVNDLDLQLFKQKIEDLAALGTRYWASPQNIVAVNYIKDKLESYGYDNVTLDPYVFQGQTRHNVYATRMGTVRPTEMYIVGAHLDSINTHGNVLDSPGADDDASGVSSVLEMARVFARARTDVSIRFALWNNEETGLNGSTAYVENHRDLQGTLEEPTWLGMIQQDMILYDHGPGLVPDADVEYQVTESAGGAAAILAELVAGAMGRYGSMPAEVGDNMAFTDSVPFQTETVAISVRENKRIDEIGEGSNPHYHQASDLFETYTEQDYEFGFNIVKMVCGAMGELTGATLLGDHDADGDVDLFDYEQFLECVTGPGGGLLPDCEAFDFNADNDVDLADQGRFQRAFTGEIE